MKDYNLITKQLHEFGLNDIETQIYLYLLNKKPQSILEIANNLNIPRTSIYDNSNKLIEKGLVERVVKYKSQKLRAFPIDILESIIDKEKEKLEKLSSNLEELKKLISPITNLTAETQVRYYEGVQGLKQMMWNALSAEGETFGYSVMGRIEIVGKKFNDKWVSEFKRRSLKDKILVSTEKTTLSYLKKYPEKDYQFIFKDVKYIPNNELYIKGDTTIYNNIFAVCYWKEGEVVGVEIENPELVKTQKTIFEILWKAARPITELL